MFVEIELGQRLGPNPGASWSQSQNPHADSALSELPPQRVVELRRFLGHRELLIEAVRNGKLSRRSLLTVVDAAQLFVEIELGQRLGPNPGWGGDHTSEEFRSSFHGNLIPKDVTARLRRFLGHRELLIEAVRPVSPPGNLPGGCAFPAFARASAFAFS